MSEELRLEEEDQKEIAEVINAANDALYHLNRADELLKSAKRWGVVDMIGGGTIISFAKQSKMRQAAAQLQHARVEIQRLKEELKDVDSYFDFDLTVDDFLGFTDIVFDNFFVDLFTQSRLSEASRQVTETIAEIEELIDALSDLIQ